MKNKIGLNRLKEIITEEISMLINEDTSASDRIVSLVTNASKLHKALEAFKTNVKDMKAVDAVSPHLDSLLEIVKNMVEHAPTYVDDPTKKPKTIVFKAQKDEDAM